MLTDFVTCPVLNASKVHLLYVEHHSIIKSQIWDIIKPSSLGRQNPKKEKSKQTIIQDLADSKWKL